jgi:hypothetical protein
MNIKKKGSLHGRQNQFAGPEQQQNNVVVVAGEEKKSDHRQRGRCVRWKYIVGMQALLAAAVLQFFHTPLNINIARGGNNTPLNVHVEIAEYVTARGIDDEVAFLGGEFRIR